MKPGKMIVAIELEREAKNENVPLHRCKFAGKITQKYVLDTPRQTDIKPFKFVFFFNLKLQIEDRTCVTVSEQSRSLQLKVVIMTRLV